MLARRGARVVVNDLGGTFDGKGADSSPAQGVVDQIKEAGGEAVANYESVSEWESAQKVIQAAIDAYGRIDILINNAGILRDKSLLKMEIADYLKVIAVHLNGTFCTKQLSRPCENRAMVGLLPPHRRRVLMATSARPTTVPQRWGSWG